MPFADILALAPDIRADVPPVNDRNVAHWIDGGRDLARSAARRLRLDAALKERRLTPEQGRRLLMEVVNVVDPVVTSITSALVAGKLKLSAWFRAFRDAILPGHFAGSLVVLDVPEPSPADLAAIVGAANGQIGFLGRFRSQVASGAALLGPAVVARSSLYAHAIWSTAQNVLATKKRREGYQFEMSHLGIADHCGRCVGEAAKGWAPIDSLIPIGSRTCQTRCHCWLEYK